MLFNVVTTGRPVSMRLAIIRLLTPHMVYQALGNTPEARQGRYRALFEREVGKVALEEIRECTNKSWRSQTGG
jgi:hypothetical protein